MQVICKFYVFCLFFVTVSDFSGYYDSWSFLLFFVPGFALFWMYEVLSLLLLC